MFLDGVCLIYGIGFCRAVKQADSFGIREKLIQHGCLFLQGSQIGCPGDILAGGSCPLVNFQRSRIVCDGGSKNRNGSGPCRCCLKGSCCICQNQIHVCRNKLIDNGCAGRGITGSILLVKFHVILAKLFYHGFLEALCCGVKRFVLQKLADTDPVYFIRIGLRCGRFTVGCRLAFRRCLDRLLYSRLRSRGSSILCTAAAAGQHGCRHC